MNYRQIYARNQMFGDCGNFIDNLEKVPECLDEREVLGNIKAKKKKHGFI